MQSSSWAFARSWLPMDPVSMDLPFHGMNITGQYPDAHVPTLNTSYLEIEGEQPWLSG